MAAAGKLTNPVSTSSHEERTMRNSRTCRDLPTMFSLTRKLSPWPGRAHVLGARGPWGRDVPVNYQFPHCAQFHHCCQAFLYSTIFYIQCDKTWNLISYVCHQASHRRKENTSLTFVSSSTVPGSILSSKVILSTALSHVFQPSDLSPPSVL